MPTFAAASATVTYTPPVLATLNDYANETLIPQGYTSTAFFGWLFGGSMPDAGLGNRPKWSIPGAQRPSSKTGEGTQAEMILNFETNGNMQAFYDLMTLNTGIYQGGTKIATPWAHYSTYCALARTTKLENTGSGKQFDLLKSQLEQSTRQAFTKLETDALSTNADINHNSAQHELAGMRHWNAASPSTGTQSTLNRATYTTYRNQTVTTASFVASGLDDMDTIQYAIAGTQGGKYADMIWTDDTQHGRYVKAATAIHRINGSLGGADLSTAGVMFHRGTPIMWHPSWPSGRIDYFTASVIHPYILAGANWDTEEPGKPNNVAIAYELRKYFTCAILVSRPEANGHQTVSAA